MKNFLKSRKNASSEQKIDQFTRRKIKGKLKGNRGELKENKGKLKGNTGKVKGNVIKFFIFSKIF